MSRPWNGFALYLIELFGGPVFLGSAIALFVASTCSRSQGMVPRPLTLTVAVIVAGLTSALLFVVSVVFGMVPIFFL